MTEAGNKVLAELENSDSNLDFTDALLRTLTGQDIDAITAVMRTKKFPHYWITGLVSNWRTAVLDHLLLCYPDDKDFETAILARQDRRYEE